MENEIMDILKNKIDIKQQYELDNDKEFAIACGQMEQYLLQKAPNEICKENYCCNFRLLY